MLMMILVEVDKLIVDINRLFHMLVHLFKREKFKTRKNYLDMTSIYFQS